MMRRFPLGGRRTDIRFFFAGSNAQDARQHYFFTYRAATETDLGAMAHYLGTDLRPARDLAGLDGNRAPAQQPGVDRRPALALVIAVPQPDGAEPLAFVKRERRAVVGRDLEHDPLRARAPARGRRGRRGAPGATPRRRAAGRDAEGQDLRLLADDRWRRAARPAGLPPRRAAPRRRSWRGLRRAPPRPRHPRESSCAWTRASGPRSAAPDAAQREAHRRHLGARRGGIGRAQIKRPRQTPAARPGASAAWARRAISAGSGRPRRRHERGRGRRARARAAPRRRPPARAGPAADAAAASPGLTRAAAPVVASKQLQEQLGALAFERHDQRAAAPARRRHPGGDGGEAGRRRRRAARSPAPGRAPPRWPMRRPVKEPGPIVTAMRSRSANSIARLVPAPRRSSAAALGLAALHRLAPRAATSAPSATTAAAQRRAGAIEGENLHHGPPRCYDSAAAPCRSSRSREQQHHVADRARLCDRGATSPARRSIAAPICYLNDEAAPLLERAVALAAAVGTAPQDLRRDAAERGAMDAVGSAARSRISSPIRGAARRIRAAPRSI